MTTILFGMLGFTVIIVLLTVVLPQFTPMFEDAGQALPLLTQIVVAVGKAVENYWWQAGLVVFLLVILVRRQLRNPGARAAPHRLQGRRPLTPEEWLV